MQPDPSQTIYYRRARFSTRLPTDRFYTASHFWLLEEQPDIWTVGFTKFALRMLGDLVEINLPNTPDLPVQVGQTIGSAEGFKAVSDLYCVADGALIGTNADLQRDLTIVDTRPYTDGWLYRVRGRPEPNAVDVQVYVDFLNLTIDKMKEQMDGQSKQC